jgi:hypothetical protein
MPNRFRRSSAVWLNRPCWPDRLAPYCGPPAARDPAEWLDARWPACGAPDACPSSARRPRMRRPPSKSGQDSVRPRIARPPWREPPAGSEPRPRPVPRSSERQKPPSSQAASRPDCPPGGELRRSPASSWSCQYDPGVWLLTRPRWWGQGGRKRAGHRQPLTLPGGTDHYGAYRHPRSRRAAGRLKISLTGHHSLALARRLRRGVGSPVPSTYDDAR